MSTTTRHQDLSTIPRANDKQKIIRHYDVVSPYYRSLWGEHLHHGYWIRGDESKEEAQRQLTEHLANLANIPTGAEVLDIGCGFGASSLYLAEKYDARTIGITISPVQVEMARQAAAAVHSNAQFLLMDAEALSLERSFDVLWSVESISHYHDRQKFFADAVQLLKAGGIFALTDWFKSERLSAAQMQKLIRPIEQGMFVELETMADYESYLIAGGLEIVHRQDLSQHCAKTWDLSLKMLQDKSLWSLAAKHGTDFVRYLKAFRAMRAGYKSGHFVYGLLVARKPAAPTELAAI